MSERNAVVDLGPEADLLEDVVSRQLQPCTGDPELGVAAVHGQHLLDFLAVELDIVEPEFRPLEVVEHDGADLVPDGGQAAEQFLVGLVVGGDVEGRLVAVVEVGQVGVVVGHAVDHEGGELAGGSLHSDFPVVEHREIGGAHGRVLLRLLHEEHFVSGGQRGDLRLDEVSQFLS